MRSGEYQLSPEHINLERAAAERSRRTQRQAFSQSSSLQSEPSVSSNAFVVQPGFCLKRSEPVNTVCVMVVFPSLSNELQMRIFLESLDSEHASSATSVKVKVPAMLIDAISFEEQLISLLQAYRTYCESSKVLPPKKGGERAASVFCEE